MNPTGLYFVVRAVFALIVLQAVPIHPDGHAVERSTMAETSSTTLSPGPYTTARVFDTENGLPGNGVTYGLQAQSGYIWFSTFNGLVRYDGYRFLIYDMYRVPELTSNRFLTVTEASGGRILAGLEYGSMLVVDGANTQVHVIDEELYGRNLSINTIYEDAHGTVWVGTENGVFQFRDDSFHPVDVFEDGASRAALMIASHNHSVLVLTADRLYEHSAENNRFAVIARVDSENGTFEYRERHRTRPDQKTGMFWQFYSTEEGLYLAHGNGAYHLSHRGIEPLVTREDIGMSIFRGIQKLNERLYVFGDNGLFELIGSGAMPPDAVPVHPVSTNFVWGDHEGSVWIASFASGVIQITPTAIYRGDTYEAVSDEAITALLLDRNDELWVGTNCDGLYHFSGSQPRRFSEQEGLLNPCVWSLLEQSDGTLWAGTWGEGVFRLVPGEVRFERFMPPDMQQAYVVLSIYEDSRGELWFGTYYNGLFRYDGRQAWPVLSQGGRTLGAVRSIVENGQGEMLFASDTGVGRLSEDGSVEFPQEWNVLSTTNFRTIAHDGWGNYWFGSYGGGLVIASGDRVRKLTMHNGLLDETVSQLQFDGQGHLWLAGNQGVFFVERAEIEQFLADETASLRISRFGVAEGLAARETTGGFMPSSAFHDNRWLYIPTVRGVTRIDTRRFEVNRQPPAVFIDEVEIDGQVHSPSEVTVMQWGEKRIVFRFSILSFKNPGHVQVEYRLDGFDSEWQKVADTRVREAVYTNLPHGRYTMLVRGTNNDGFRIEEAFAFSFVITPPYWRTWWFYGLVVLAFASLIAVVYLGRMSRIEQANRELEEQVQKRTRELATANEELEQLVDQKNRIQRLLGHDLRNPIASIISYLELIKSEDGQVSREEQQYMIDLLLASSRESLNLLENLMHFSSVTHRGFQPEFRPIAMDSLVKEAVSVTRSQAERKKIGMEHHIDPALEVEADRVMMMSIVRNLLSNAVKFSTSGSTVVVKAWKQNGQVGLSVTDQGEGMEAERVERLFLNVAPRSKRGTGGEKGMGLGLQICKDFVEKHNGTIRVESRPGQGSTFTVLLPVTQSG